MPLISTGDGGYLVDGAGHSIAWAPDEFARLADLPAAEIYLAADLRPRDPATGLERRLLLTTAPRLHTEATDDPPNAIHRSLLLRGWSTSRRLSERGRFLGSSTYVIGTLVVDNSAGDITDWMDLDWSDAAVELKVGGRLTASGRAYPYALFHGYFTGVAEEARPGGDSTIEIAIVGRKRSLDQQLVEETYSNLGGAVKVPQGGSLSGTVPATPLVDAELTIEWFGTVDSFPVSEGALFRVDQGGAPNYGVAVLADRTLQLDDSDGGHFPSGYALPVEAAGEKLEVAVVYRLEDGVQVADLYIAIAGGELERVGHQPIVLNAYGPLVDAGGTVEVGTFNTGGGVAITASEIRLSRGAKTDDQLAARCTGPLLTPTEDADLIECWKFEDAVDITASGELGVCDLTLAGGADFTASLEGDDPSVFPGGPGSQSKPDGWGRASNVRLVNVDTPRHVGQWSRQPSRDLLRLYVGGAPMVPDITLVDAVGGLVSFVAATKEIVFAHSEPALPGEINGHHFVPGQTDPPRTGQRIEVTGSALNNGVFTIAADGVLDEGRRIRVIEALADETGPFGTTVKSLLADVQYTFNTVLSTAATPSDVSGDLTADVVLWLSSGGTAKVSEVVAEILGAEINTDDLEWDPEVGLWLPPGASITKKDAVDRLVTSAFAWWIEARGGGYRIGNWKLPAGAPVSVVDGSRISTIAPVTTITPYSRFLVGHSTNYTVQDRSALAGSVPAYRREILGAANQLTLRKAPQKLRKKFPLAKARPEIFATCLVRARDAEIFADYAAPFYMDKRRWFDIAVSGVGLLSLDLNDCVWLQHPDPTHKLTAGALARILSMEENTGTDQVGIEVFL